MLAVSMDKVKDAPNVESGEQLSDSEQETLREYYSGCLGTADEVGGQQEAGSPGQFPLHLLLCWPW